MKKLIPLFISLIILSVSCNKDNNIADAWGNFEAREVLISSESNGRILSFPVEEGQLISEGDIIAVIDSAFLALQIDELEASRSSVNTNIHALSSQNEIIKQQIINLKVNISRIGKMLEDEAATQKQYDDLIGQRAVLEKQIDANNARKNSIRSEIMVLDAKKEQVLERISRCTILSPSDGSILQKYAEKGEVTNAGKPLIKIADLTTMELKVYVSGAELARVIAGEDCMVRIDKGESEYYEYKASIKTVSDKAEFTPKIIQTKEERVNMVYAVTIDVKNDGMIKSGMPGEAIFAVAEL